VDGIGRLDSEFAAAGLTELPRVDGHDHLNWPHVRAL
jgi:hypothetical protein